MLELLDDLTRALETSRSRRPCGERLAHALESCRAIRHSHTNSASSASKRWALSAIRSLTLRKIASVVADESAFIEDNAEADTVSRVLPEPVQRVADFLGAAGAEARLEEFPEEIPTVRDVAKTLGVDPGQIVKTLVFVCDGRPVVALVPGDRRADGAKIARAVGAGSARIATRDEVEAATGFPPGAVAPFPLPAVDTILLEQTLLTLDYVWVGAGSERHLARLPASELLRLSRARQMDAVEDHTYHSG